MNFCKDIVKAFPKGLYKCKSAEKQRSWVPVTDSDKMMVLVEGVYII